MNSSSSPAIPRILRHCSLYSVTGNRPTPYNDSPPFSLTLRLSPRTLLFFSLSFSARNRSISAFRSSSDIVLLLRQSTTKDVKAVHQEAMPRLIRYDNDHYFGLAVAP